MRNRLTQVKNLIGPYNYSPLFISLTIMILNLPRLRAYSYDYPFGAERIRFLLVGLAITVITAVPLYLCLKVFQFFRKARPKNFANYLFEVLVAVIVSLLIQIAVQQYLIEYIHVTNFLRTGRIIPEILSRFFCAILLVAVTNYRHRTLQFNLDRAQELNDDLADRYEVLIASDEEIRSHAAQLLHDRIQSKLMLTGAKLTRLGEGLSSEARDAILQLVSELEEIRSIEVRDVSQLLTPNLEGDGLLGSCENLCQHYKSDIKFTIAIDERLERVSSEYKLGIYRIIEQAVVNAIKHGPAAHVTIRACSDEIGGLSLEVSDDGPGSIMSKPGKGTVIIDSWISKLDARKEIVSLLAGGYTLRVLIPKP